MLVVFMIPKRYSGKTLYTMVPALTMEQVAEQSLERCFNPGAEYYDDEIMTFQPYEYGDGWAKKTALWGKFNHPKKIYTAKNRPVGLPGLYVRPGRGYPSLAFQHKSAVQHIPQFQPFADFIKTDYDLRSITPPQFAKAFFEANN